MKYLRNVIMFFLSLAGLVISAFLLAWHYAPELSLIGFSCSASVGCGRLPEYSFMPAGLPAALLGLYYYMFILAALLVRRISPERIKNGLLFVTAIVSAASVTAGIVFSVRMLMSGFLCPYCLAVHVINFIIFSVLLYEVKINRVFSNGPGEIFIDFSRMASGECRTIYILFIIITVLLVPAADSANIYIKNTAVRGYSKQKLIDRTVKEAYWSVHDLGEMPPSLMVLGSADAKVKLTVFTDFLCSSCMLWHKTEEKLLQEYGDKISISYYLFPLESSCNDTVSMTVYRNSCEANSAVLFAAKNSLFKEMLSYHYSALKREAENIRDGNLSTYERFFNDRNIKPDYKNNPEMSSIIKSNVNVANKLGISSTPSIFINGRLVKGAVPYEVFRRIIEKELAAE